MGTMQRFIDKARTELPDPGTTALSHALHTLAAFANSPDDELIVVATSGVYETRTGLTWGDLRKLVGQAQPETTQVCSDPAHCTHVI